MYFIDLHEDLVIYFSRNRKFLKMKLSDFARKDTTIRHADLPTYSTSNTKIIFCSLFPLTHVGKQWKSVQPEREMERQISKYKALAKKYPRFYLVRSKADIENNFNKKDSIGMILHMEGAEAIRSAEDVDKYYRMGVRSIGLTWDHRNQLAGGLGSNAGLTDLGRKVVLKMRENKMILDLVHANEESFYAMSNIWTKPFMVSHTAVRKFGKHKQGLTDRQIKLVVSRGGIMGITFLPVIYGKGAITINHVVEHLNYVKNRYGTNFLSIGSDFFGFQFDEHVAGIKNMDDLGSLIEKLKLEGWTKNEIEKLFWKNAYNFIVHELA